MSLHTDSKRAEEEYEKAQRKADATEAAILAYSSVYKIAPLWDGGDEGAWNEPVIGDPILSYLLDQATAVDCWLKSARRHADYLLLELRDETRELTIAALAELPADEETTLWLRFGSVDSVANAVGGILDAHAVRTYDEVGQLLSISPEQVHDIESYALRKLGQI